MLYCEKLTEQQNEKGWGQVNSWQMLCFDTVVKTKNFSEAARELYISQQALSKQIQKLETTLGVKILSRKPHVDLTPEGEIVYEAVSQMLAIERRMNLRLKNASHSKEMIKLGLGFTRNRYLLTTFYPWFRKEHPDIELQIQLEKASVLQKMLLSGAIDFWIGYLAEQNVNLECVDLFEDQLIFLVPKNLLPPDWNPEQNPLSVETGEVKGFNPNELPIMLLPKGHTLRTTAEDYINDFGITPNVILENNDNESLLMLCFSGEGALFASKTLLARYQSYLALDNMLMFLVPQSRTSQKVSIMYRKNSDMTNSQQVFLQACIDKLGEI